MLDFDSTGCGEAEHFALQVLGTSMEPEFPDQCIVIIDPAGVAEDGAYVIANYRDELIFRQLRIIDERYYLVPLNDAFPTHEIAGPEEVKGIIVQRAGTRRSMHKHYT